MDIKRKKCRSCGELFFPYKTTDSVCSSICALKMKESKVLAEKERINTSVTQTRISSLELAKAVFNAYIRERDKNEKSCICCDAPLGERFEAGHYYSGGGHSNVIFDERNVHAQRFGCNNFKAGNFLNYGVKLEQKIGKIEFELLRQDAYTPKKWETEELKRIIYEYRKKTIELKKI